LAERGRDRRHPYLSSPSALSGSPIKKKTNTLPLSRRNQPVG
jgi:hypothetical protein